jgi:hypothetical protein
LKDLGATLAVCGRGAIIGSKRNMKESGRVANDWQMPRRGATCHACEREFEPGDPVQAYLYESPEGYERRDFCTGCEPPEQPAPVGFWKTCRPQPTARKAVTFDRAAIFEFFERLEDADTTEQHQLRFVLALLLWRKKMLKLDRSDTAEGTEVWHFVVPRTGAEHAVRRPDLDEEQLERLGTQLEALLASQVGELSAIAPDSNEDRPHG